jgi:hypothetical protein
MQLTGCGIDEIIEDSLSKFDIVCQEFMDIFKEEVRMTPTDSPSLTSTIHDGRKYGAVWFWRRSTSVNAMFSLVEDHIGPGFLPLSTKTEGILSQYWCQGSPLAAERKVAEREEYVKQSQVLFNEDAGLSTKEDS